MATCRILGNHLSVIHRNHFSRFLVSRRWKSSKDSNEGEKSPSQQSNSDLTIVDKQAASTPQTIEDDEFGPQPKYEPNNNPKAIKKYTLPDENPDLPKKVVFQDLTTLQNENTPIFTFDEAALPDKSAYLQTVFKYPKLAANFNSADWLNRGVDNKHTTITHVPMRTDYVFIGSGLIGSAAAYYTKRRVSRGSEVVVFDKDPYSPNNCTAACNGLISAQSMDREASRMATLTKELIRNLQYDLVVSDEDWASINYHPVTHLMLWSKDSVEDVLNAVDHQIEDGLFTEVKLPGDIEASFPWLKASETDIALGTHGNQDEALIDPIALRNLFRTVAQAYGAAFIRAEAIDFNLARDRTQTEYFSDAARALVVRMPRTGELRHVGFATVMLALGHNTPYLESRAEMETYMRDRYEDLHFVQPRMRLRFSFNSLNLPLINFPVITDTDGSQLFKVDYAGNFDYYLTLQESEKFFADDQDAFMDLDSEECYANLFHRDPKFADYFYNVIKPRLVNRIPLMEDAEFRIVRSSFESCNMIDGMPIMGPHPFYGKIHLSLGYGNRLASYSVAAGLLLSDYMVDSETDILDYTRYFWDRVITGRRIKEAKSLRA